MTTTDDDGRKAKRHLGDGAYVQHGSYRGEIELTAENGIRATDRVILGPDELTALLSWLREEHQIVTFPKHGGRA